MITYHSTRGDKQLFTFSDAILKGIAPDGGLFVPEKIPHIPAEQLQQLVNKSYQKKAAYILKRFGIDFTEEQIDTIVNKAYASNFDTKEIAPVTHVTNNTYILELWHGPTAAFKDMALQIMPLFFSEAVKKDNAQKITKGQQPLRYLILAATSGDTGKAALEGYKDKDNISIMVFYPNGRVSQLQELQMKTQEGNNVYVFAVNGDFDDTQRLVKDMFNDETFNNKLKEKFQIVLSSANSINWGRLLPQIVYHVSSYCDLVKQNVIQLGDPIDVVVPSGNFGNLLAAYYAKKMGLPIRQFICASNENNVLTEFLQTGIYSIKNRKLVQTPSPSMDILIANNIERLLYLITNNAKQISEWMTELKTNGIFEVDETTKQILQKEFFADWVANNDCLTNIKKVYEEHQYLMDTHTSVAYIVAERFLKQERNDIPIIICSTANWAKFPESIARAIFPEKAMPNDAFEVIDIICSLDKNISAPKSINELRDKKVLHTKTIDADKAKIEQQIETLLI